MVISEGRYGIVSYKTEKEYDSTTYRIICSPELIFLAKANFCEFVNSYVPNYGKYEVEEFIAKMLLISLITGNVEELFNTSISYDDSPYNCGDYSKNTIKRSILQYCEIFHEDKERKLVTLKYHGKKLSNF